MTDPICIMHHGDALSPHLPKRGSIISTYVIYTFFSEPNRQATQQTQQPISFCSNKQDGLYPDPLDCTMYIECVQTRTYKISCPSGTAFHLQNGVCDYKHKISRCNP